MPFQLTDEEYERVALVLESDLVDLAVELDLPVEAAIDRRALLSRCVEALAELAGREGLPFSNFDREDLEALPPEQLGALARTLGVPEHVSAVIKAGRKLYKRYRKERRDSQVPLLLPSLLGPLCRFLAEREG